MDTRLTFALKGFRERFPGGDADWKRLAGWLADHAPAEKRGIKALVAFARLGLHERLGAEAAGRLDAFGFRRAVDALTNEEGLSGDLAEQAVLAWLAALGIDPPDAAALRGPLDRLLVTATLDASRCLHLALAQSALRPIASVRLESLTAKPLSELVVSLWLAGSEVGSNLRSTTWSGVVDRLRPRQIALLDGVDVRPNLQPLHELQASAGGRYWIEIRHKDEVLLRTFEDVEVLPPRQWLLGRAPAPTLAAFVLPDDPVVAEIVAEAATRAAEGDARPAAIRAFDSLAALVGELAIAVESGAPDRLVGPRTIVRSAQTSALELQLLYAACLEHAGLAPLLVWASSGPALGLWTVAERPAFTETDDPSLLARLADAGSIAFVAIGAHVLDLGRETAGDFCAVDVAAARRAGVVALPAAVLDDGRSPARGDGAAALMRTRLLDRAALVGARSGLLLPGAWNARLAHTREGTTPDATPPRLATWKRRLLDLTLNNPLLNLRERASSLPLQVLDAGALEHAIASGRTLVLEARPAAFGVRSDRQGWEGALAAGTLPVDLPERRLAIQARNTTRAFRAALEEGGVHTLFLALGMLVWSEPGKVEGARRAPLLLVPILVRRSRRGHFEAKRADADTEFNAALLEYLRREYGVDVPGVDPLPSDGTGIDVRRLFGALQAALASSPATSRFEVREDEGVIAVISFSGFRMWRDLDHQAADLLRHPLVRRLALGHGDTDDKTVPFVDATTLDERWHPKDVFCPLEADGSQLAAVLAAAEGGSFVLEGPPGTGKSQTIANLVSQCLADGKSVLFVAQKRAALEVVQARLDAIGLGPFILELHSRKASKPEFIQQLRTAAEFRARKPARDFKSEADLLAAARSELNAVVHALHRIRGAGGTSVFRAVCALEARRAAPRLDARALGAGPWLDITRAFGFDWLGRARAALADLAAAFARLAPNWQELEPVRATDWPAARRQALEVELAALAAAGTVLGEASEPLVAWFPSLSTASRDDLDLADVVMEGVETSPQPRPALVAGGEEELVAWLDKVETARGLAGRLDARYAPAILDEPLATHARRLRQWLPVFAIGWLVLFFTVRWVLRGLSKATLPPNREILPDVDAALALTVARRELAAAANRIAALAGPEPADPWGVPTPDAAELRKLAAWSKGFRNRAHRFPSALALASAGAPDVHAAVAAFRAAHARYAAAASAVQKTLDLASGLTKPTEPEHLARVAQRAASLRARIGDLRDYGAYRRNREACFGLGLERVVRLLERGTASADTVVEAFETSFLALFVDQHVLTDAALAAFDGLKQRGREERFAALDRALVELSADEIRARLAARQPRLDQGAPPTSQAGILLRQFNRRTGFATPRQLFSECAGLIRDLKPCVLMSPQSVAQYLDPSQPPFDIVVFDEASQVPVHEAIGAIARGRQVVVVGDSKQLPPTAFFLSQGREQEPDDDEVVAELDSILEECAASGLPSHGLEWHYRSRHPSLIAFSNSRYYGGRLQVLPAARAHAPHLGVSRVLVAGAVYDRGGTATNRREAEALVAELVRRLTDPFERGRTLGVVTFSSAQQALIEDLIEGACEAHPEIEVFFDAERREPVIVKNLESIQGDERDVMLFSIGYGPDARGRLTANMGPLGQLGGERRLNVAVTRAREELVVFTSFEPAALDLSGSAAKGLHDLKAFLYTAAARGDAVTASDHVAHEAGEAALVNAVAARLTAAGHAVDADVGVGRFRIDLAVRDPAAADTYLVAIELDGARCAATDTARDRERLRREVLAGLGWRHCYRIRALDWHENAEAVAIDLLAYVDRACREPPPVETVVPVAETRVVAAAESSLDLTPSVSSVEPPTGTPNPGPAAPMTPTPAPTDPAPDSGEEGFVARGDAAFGGRGRHEMTYVVASRRAPHGAFRWDHDDLPRVVADIVAAEGPLSERMLARRIGECFGAKRAPSGLGAALGRLLPKIALAERPSARDGFLWPANLDPRIWRSYRVPDPHGGGSRRDAEDICLEEIANAAAALRSSYGDMTREALARALAKRFGFRGLTKVVGERMDRGIDLAAARDDAMRR